MNIDEKIAIVTKGASQHSEIEEIKERFLEAEKTGRKLIIKLGLDPTAPDIHLGHGVVLRKIKQLQDLGCIAIIIIGDFTGAIGDPSGKSKTRKQLSKDEVLENAKTYQDQIFKIIDPDMTEVRFNSEWLSKLNLSEVANLASKSTVARMMERDDFENRFTNNKPIGLHEFLYPLMQAYDSVAINADIELGGTDQTFNILLGRKIQREYNQVPQLTLLMPLLEGIDGVEKMSKSLGNYIGINENATIMFEKIMKIPDNLIIRFYELCTDIRPNQINIIKSDLDGGKNPRDIKMDLAKEIVSLYHDKDDVLLAIESFKKAYQKGVAPDNSPKLIIDSKGNIGENIINQLVNNNYFESKSQVRRLFRQNAVSINNIKINDINSIISIKNADVLKIGKSRYFILDVI